MKRRAGANLASVIGNNLVGTPQQAVLELVINSYDADATKVNVRFDTVDTLEALIIEDNGTGMNEEGIGHFYRLGDSQKKVVEHTAKGRRVIGQYGIATVLLQYLGNAYTLETWKDGEKKSPDAKNR